MPEESCPKNPCNITTGDVRNMLLDRCPADNSLLMRVEIDDKIIRAGVQDLVDRYNETPPPIARLRVSNFPFRRLAILGAAAYALRAYAINHERNRLSSETLGGTRVDDRDKFNPYMEAFREMDREVEAKIREIKISRNVRAAWGRSGSLAYRGRR